MRRFLKSDILQIVGIFYFLVVCLVAERGVGNGQQKSFGPFDFNAPVFANASGVEWISDVFLAIGYSSNFLSDDQ